MNKLNEATISRAILDTYHHVLRERLVGDVLIARARPAGPTTIWCADTC